MVANEFEEDYNIFETYKEVDGKRVFLPSIKIHGKSSYLTYDLYLESEEELTELIKCYQNDILNISEEAIKKLMRKNSEYCILDFNWTHYAINEDFKNTMDFINQRDLICF